MWNPPTTREVSRKTAPGSFAEAARSGGSSRTGAYEGGGAAPMRERPRTGNTKPNSETAEDANESRSIALIRAPRAKTRGLCSWKALHSTLKSMFGCALRAGEPIARSLLGRVSSTGHVSRGICAPPAAQSSSSSGSAGRITTSRERLDLGRRPGERIGRIHQPATPSSRVARRSCSPRALSRTRLTILKVGANPLASGCC